MIAFRDQKLRARFLLMPYRVIERLKRLPVLTARQRSDGEAAFAAAFFAKAPLRIAELVCLQFGTHIIERGIDRDRTVAVHIGPDEVKNKVPRDFVMSPRLAKLMEDYLAYIRTEPQPGAPVALFPGETAFRNAHSLSQNLAKLTSREIGVRMTADQWRLIMGYIFLLHNPGSYETVRQFLGHRSIETTVEYYAFMTEDDAFGALDACTDQALQEAMIPVFRLRRKRARAP